MNRTAVPYSEAEFLSQIVEVAQLHGWLAHHTRPAWSSKGYRTPIQGDPGFPDLVLVRPPLIIMVEVKSERGRLSPAQQRWIAALEVCTSADFRIWRPSDWDRIVETLR